VTATGMPYNAVIKPGKSVTFGFIGNLDAGPNPAPALFTLNGAACS
jgi:endoglucanase